jgi:hypothetical protein
LYVEPRGAADEKFRAVSQTKKAVISHRFGMQPLKIRNLERFFLPAFVAQPHHAADSAGRCHHFRRLHRFAAALRNVQIYDRFLGRGFSCFTQFCHGNSPPLLIAKPVHSIDIGENVKNIFKP